MAKLRDFKEFNTMAPNNINTHPDFETMSSCPDTGYVLPTIATDRPVDPAVFPLDNRSPVFSGKFISSKGVRCFSSPSRFEDWYNDRGPDTNRAFLTNLVFNLNPVTNLYEYNNAAFFPLDTNIVPRVYTKIRPTDPEPFGHLQAPPDNIHNFGFTMEFHATFTYVAGKSQAFTFSGDDDVWVFINGKKVIDLGGRHSKETQQINLDSMAAQLGLADYNNYILDFFFAERHTSQSNCVITTSLVFDRILDKPSLPPSTNFDSIFVVNITHPVPGAKLCYTLDGTIPDTNNCIAATGPITISSTTTVKVIALKDGWKPSEVASVTYTKVIGLPTPAAQVVRAVYIDENGDGRIDGAVITLDTALTDLPSSVKLEDPFSKNSVLFPAGSISHGPAAKEILVRFPDTPFTQGTAFPTGDYGQFPAGSRFASNPFPISDSVGPILIKAVSTNKQNPSDKPYVDITFSEPIDIQSLQANLSWPFVIYRNGGVLTKSVQVSSLEPVPGQVNTYRWTFTADSPAFPVYIDSLALGSTPSVTDNLGNKGLAEMRKIPVEGDKQILANQILVEVTNPITKENIPTPYEYPDIVHNNPFAAIGAMPGQGEQCLTCLPGTEQSFLNPQPVPEWRTKTKYPFNYTFTIYDNLGQFVAKTGGQITDEMLAKLPIEADGFKYVRFRWIPLAQNHSKVGTGAYILRGDLLNRTNETQKGSQGEDQILKSTETTVLKTFGYLRQN